MALYTQRLADHVQADFENRALGTDRGEVESVLSDKTRLGMWTPDADMGEMIGSINQIIGIGIGEGFQGDVRWDCGIKKMDKEPQLDGEGAKFHVHEFSSPPRVNAGLMGEIPGMSFDSTTGDLDDGQQPWDANNLKTHAMHRKS